MTCIVAQVDDVGGIWMGGDSSASAGQSIEICKEEKVFSRGTMLIGYTTSFRMGQLLKHTLNVPVHDSHVNTLTYLVNDFTEAIRSCFKAAGLMKRIDEVEEAGQFLIGYRGRLYIIESDFAVLEPYLGFTAIGAGSEVAKGAMSVTRDMEPRERLMRALESAAEFCTCVRKPFYFRHRLPTRSEGATES